MVSVQDVSVSYGSLDLLVNISFLIGTHDRIGLTGKNGAGKSTLLKIIAGLQEPTTGIVDKSKEVSTGYLPQQMKFHDTTTIMEEATKAFSEIIILEGEIERCRTEIARRSDYESPGYTMLCDQLAETEERYRLMGGSNYLADTEQVLLGLGFERKDFNRPTNELSGGWRMRIEIARILLSRPSLLLLDEPTNHLDIESIQWMESFLKDYRGAVILVSHDCAFLDNITQRTIEISLGNIFDYKVPWSQYVILSKERRAQQMAAYKNQQKKIEDTEKFIKRFRSKATKANQVQSRIKQLEKIERIEVDEEDISSINLRFPPASRTGTVVIDTEGISKRFGNVKVLDNIDFRITRGEKVAFVGRNGEGKTTMSRILAGELSFEGKLKTGHNVVTGYFAQDQDEKLDNNKSVLQTIEEHANGITTNKIRDILGAFLFRGDDVDKKTSVLSGGERSRLALVRLLMEKANMLILDEPTNHLDMRSKDILKQALLKYDGTLIVVSHDRDFLDGIVGKIYEFRNKRIKENIGGIYDFLRSRQTDSLTDIEKSNKARYQNPGKKMTVNKMEYLTRKEHDRNLRRLRKKIEESEKEIENIEEEIRTFNKALAEPNDHRKEDTVDYALHKKLTDRLNKEMGRWTMLCKEVEKMSDSKTDNRTDDI
jgi:ATP-binding cassette, subfamily F, member 3